MTTTKPPTERSLPNKQAILDRILAGTAPAQASGPLPRQAEQPGPATKRPERDWRAPKRRTPGWAVPVLACAAVAAVVGAILIVPQTLKSGDPAVTPASKPAEAEVDLDLGPLSQPEIAQVLAICPPWEKPYRVLHATKIRTGWGKGQDWTVAVEGHDPGGNGIPPGDGRLIACSGYPIKTTAEDLAGKGIWWENFVSTSGPAPSAEELAKLPKGESFIKPRYDDSFRPQELIQLQAEPDKKWATRLWIRTPSTVDRVRQRILVDGTPRSPWFSSKAVDGLSFTQAWIDAPISRSAKYTVEVQFLDKSNRLVEIPGSTGPTSVVEGGGFGFNKTYKNSDYYFS
ncbi:hypothetical protein [Kribbella sp. NPDC051620]|uniref:hypothetical protein n=1 Tax=Kribbella sp. NPDC051620 TaxID=3364120 RepID=UPI00378D1C67